MKEIIVETAKECNIAKTKQKKSKKKLIRNCIMRQNGDLANCSALLGKCVYNKFAKIC